MDEIETKFRPKRRRAFKTCCCGYSLQDGVHGIILWDVILVIFVGFNGAATFLYYATISKNYIQAIADFATTAFLIIRAIFGLWVVRKRFGLRSLKWYLITRVFWDVCLLIGYLVVFILKKMPLTSFIFNIVIIISLDGYFNGVIFTFRKYQVEDLKD